MLFGGAVLTSIVQTAELNLLRAICCVCPGEGEWQESGVAGSRHSTGRGLVLLESDLLVDFTSCVGSQNVARPIAESEDG